MTSTHTPSSEEASRVSPATLLSFVSLTLSIFLVALDTVLIPTALPTISRSFHISDSLYAWTGSAYLLANAASVPVWGKLSDIFGRKPVVLIANSIFLVGSLICATSVSGGMLVGGRVVQGLGGGGVVVLVHICVANLFSLRYRGFYLGIVGASWAVASALGPVLGGIFAQKLNWRWCFYVNIPIVTVSTILLYFTLHIPSPRIGLLSGIRSIDWPGSLTITLATTILLIGLQFGGQSLSWNSPKILCLLVFGALTYILFFLTQYLSEKHDWNAPIMPLRIFSDTSNLSALAVCACDALVFNSVAYFLPLYFQIVLAASPALAGVYMLALATPLAIVSLSAGFIIERTGRYLEVLRAGLVLMTVGVGLLISFSPTKNMGQVIGYLIVLGIGFGPNFHAPLIALQTRIKESDIAAGTAAFGFVRMVSGAIGVGVGQVIFAALMRGHLGGFVEAGIDGEIAQRLAGGEAISEAGNVGRLPEVLRSVVRAGMTGSLRGTWIFYTAVSAVGLAVSFGIKKEVLSRTMPGKPEGEQSTSMSATRSEIRSVADEEMGVERREEEK
ncbi:major facilitator superfamily domain-containing protein [Clohesyomyces aquaticus]|uniref:Major facilitator superfamily domain-containing protein n=1 Tax=Clohesyomyces aquaticus TaxID=1231657 RepID=A0A1Y1Y8N3_9PLEO|nr:major facilitator superfamily domain-containing protein [Clohesyomyces aquaticus]